MAAEWFYECRSHEPHLREHFDFSSRTSMAQALEHRDEINSISDYVWDELHDSSLRHWWWLRTHKECTVVLINEYGQTLLEWMLDKKM